MARYTRPRPGGVRFVAFDPSTGRIEGWLNIADNSFRVSDYPSARFLRAGNRPADDITDAEWEDSEKNPGRNPRVNRTNRKVEMDW